MDIFTTRFSLMRFLLALGLVVMGTAGFGQVDATAAQEGDGSVSVQNMGSVIITNAHGRPTHKIIWATNDGVKLTEFPLESLTLHQAHKKYGYKKLTTVIDNKLASFNISFERIHHSNEIPALVNAGLRQNQNCESCFCPSTIDFCGYRLRYNPIGNCSKIDWGGSCSGRRLTLIRNRIGNRWGTLLPNLHVGAPLMIDVSGLNLSRYNVTVNANQVSNEQDISQLLSYVNLALGNLGLVSFTQPEGPVENTSVPFVSPAGTMQVDMKMDVPLDGIVSFTDIDCETCNLIDVFVKAHTTSIFKDSKADLQNIVSFVETGQLSCILATECSADIIPNDNITRSKVLDRTAERLIDIYDKQEIYNSVNADIEKNSKAFDEKYKLLTAGDAICDYNKELDEVKELRVALDKNTRELKKQGAVLRANAHEMEIWYFKDNDSKAALAEYTSKIDFNTLHNDTIATAIMRKITAIRLDNISPYVRFNIPRISRNTDYVDIAITATPRGAATEPDAKPQGMGGYNISGGKNSIISIPTYGGVNFAFGTGLVATGFANPGYNLVADSVYTRGVNGDSVTTRGTRLRRSSGANTSRTINIGVAAQAFITYRARNYWYFGGTVGLAYTSDKNGSLLLGGAILYGKKVKVGLSAGYALSTVSTPKGDYAIGDTKGSRSLDFVNYRNNDVEYDISFRHNWFVGLTLNFGSFTKKSPAQAGVDATAQAEKDKAAAEKKKKEDAAKAEADAAQKKKDDEAKAKKAEAEAAKKSTPLNFTISVSKDSIIIKK